MGREVGSSGSAPPKESLGSSAFHGPRQEFGKEAVRQTPAQSFRVRVGAL